MSVSRKWGEQVARAIPTVFHVKLYTDVGLHIALGLEPVHEEAIFWKEDERTVSILTGSTPAFIKPAPPIAGTKLVFLGVPELLANT